MIQLGHPAVVLAPMEGVTDAPMRELMGQFGAFSFAVSEFQRVSIRALPAKVFLREVPELANGGLTRSGMPVYVQILGGDPDLMAQTAVNACSAGTRVVDINFGCPAPVVNRRDGGASLLRYPCRILEIVQAVRHAVPREVPVSAKLRLGWDSNEDIFENAQMAQEGGAAWITIHARTKVQGYRPPVFWPHIRQVRESLDVPVVANGDIWTLDDFKRCREETGALHFMLGRGALANPALPRLVAQELGLPTGLGTVPEWSELFHELVATMRSFEPAKIEAPLFKLKQWAKLAHAYGEFPWFEEVKTARTVDEFLRISRSFGSSPRPEAAPDLGTPDARRVAPGPALGA
ncbi:MAG: tRNA-dihydrouridine synthase family protein [Armatimonadetes bacterium]|nr:tRNA-dihydrouridine synthase family protein [Armatimonadota bacterium]